MAKDTTYRDLDDGALLQELADTKDALFKLRFRNATGQLDNVSELKKHRKVIARINTELRAREIAAADVFCSPVDNIQESFGLSPVEAMARKVRRT